MSNTLTRNIADLANMLQNDGTRRAVYEFICKQCPASPPPSIVEYANRPDTTASTLYRVDRITSVTFSGLGFVPRWREGFCVFYSDRAIAYSVSKSLKIIEYGEEDCDVLRLPYSSDTLLPFWDTYQKRQSWPNGVHNFVSLWLLLEHLQQVRLYAIMDATSVSEVEMEKEFIMSQFAQEDIALKRRVCVALNTIIGMAVTEQSRRLLVLVASVLSFTKYTPSEKEVIKDIRRYGVDEKISPVIRKMIKTMREQDKLSKSVPVQTVRLDAILHWQRAIRMQIKQNRQGREQTARNRVESRRREIIRARCNVVKASKGADCVLSQPGPSGPQKKVAWVAQDVDGPSETAKREAKKKMAHEAILANAERQRAQTERQAKIEAERMRNLQIADDMMQE